MKNNRINDIEKGTMYKHAMLTPSAEVAESQQQFNPGTYNNQEGIQVNLSN